MLELLSEKSGPVVFLPEQDAADLGNLVLENADKTIVARAIVRADFQAIRCALRFMTDERLVFSDPETPFVLLFVFNYSLQLQLPSLMKREMHDRAVQLIFVPRGRFTIEFQKGRDYQLDLFFYTNGFIRKLEDQAGPFWPGRTGRTALYFNKALICSRSMFGIISGLFAEQGSLADADESLSASVLSILRDFSLGRESRFQPGHLSAAQLDGFYAERDRLLLLATKTISFSRLLTLAEIRDRPLFRKRMNQLYGINIRDFIIQTRMEKASLLLADFGLSIKQIAGLTGFKNPFYFSRVFSRYFGKPPTSFRSGLSA